MTPPEGLSAVPEDGDVPEGDTRPPDPRRPFVIVTGLSGAGKSSAMNVLEDLGYETVDNPPLAILESLVNEECGPIAAGVDTRTRGFEPEALLAAIRRLKAQPGIAVRLFFVTADEGVLICRYTETRRRHPFAPGGPLGTRVIDGIQREMELLRPLLEAADIVLDTSELPLHAFRRRMEAEFRLEGVSGLSIQVMSFAFPKGLPREADLVFDVRFLSNPHYDPVLRPLTGLDANVAAHVAADPDFPGFWTRLQGFLDPLLPRYEAEGKKYLTVAIGCTGGKHRSVFLAERLADHLRRQGWRAESAHRELASFRGISRTSPAQDAAVPLPGSPRPPSAMDPSSTAPHRAPAGRS
jgi:UPF0042 nucleotide-binding protein